MKVLNIIAITAVLSGFLPAHTATGNQRICTKAEELQALDESDSLKDWNAVHRSFKRFAQCDDGAVGEGYSDTVGRLLTKDWKEITTLGTLFTADHEFERFVLRHIDETLPADELRSIARSATRNCPAGQNALCKKIQSAAKAVQSP